MFFRIGLLENFANFRGKDLCWSLFLIKLLVWRSATLLKWDSKTGVILSCEICEILKNIFFYRTSPVAASERLKKWFYFRTKAVFNCWISWFFWSHFSSISKKIQRLMDSQTKPSELIKLPYQCNLQLVVSSGPKTNFLKERLLSNMYAKVIWLGSTPGRRTHNKRSERTDIFWTPYVQKQPQEVFWTKRCS